MKWFVLPLLAVSLLFSAPRKKKAEPARPKEGEKCQTIGTAHPCRCNRMVHRVQQSEIDKCASGPDSTTPKAALAELKTCMARVPDHCQIIGSLTWDEFSDGGKDKCTTHCFPQKCGCLDGICAAHSSWSGEPDLH